MYLLEGVLGCILFAWASGLGETAWIRSKSILVGWAVGLSAFAVGAVIIGGGMEWAKQSYCARALDQHVCLYEDDGD
jgi:hypothetical protein